MSERIDYDAINEAKAEYTGIYNARDPRLYFRTLQQVDYRIPLNAKPLFEAVFETFRRQRGAETPNILDIGAPTASTPRS
jgi:hypothetical protein